MLLASRVMGKSCPKSAVEVDKFDRTHARAIQTDAAPEDPTSRRGRLSSSCIQCLVLKVRGFKIQRREHYCCVLLYIRYSHLYHALGNAGVRRTPILCCRALHFPSRVSREEIRT